MTISQKAFAIVFILVAAIAGGSIMFSKMGSQQSAATPSPSPSIDSQLFPSNQQTSPGTQQSNLQGQVQGAQTQANQQQAQTQTPVRHYDKFPGVYPTDQLQNKKAVIVTNKGTIEFEIYPDAPKAASNFIFLTINHFYDGLTFHRVVPGFVIQGGDPAGNGTGGPGYTFEDEPVTKKYDKGIVAMANAGPNTNGSQFFIMLADNPDLPPNYTIFGKVTKGQEVVDQIKVGDVMQQVSIQATQ